MLRDPSFVGRTAPMEQLRRAMGHIGAAAIHDAPEIHGGTGKTALALEYAYRYADEYHAVFWLHAEHEAVLAAEYALLAAQIGLPQSKSDDQPERINAVRHWLAQRPGWLLVLDGLQETRFLERFIPEVQTGHVIITARAPFPELDAPAVPLGPFEPEEALACIEARTGHSGDPAAFDLASCTGRLPLPLSMAAAWAAKSGNSLAVAAENIRAVLAAANGAAPASPDAPVLTYAALTAILRQLSQDCRPGRDLLALGAFLGSHSIAHSLLHDGKAFLTQRLARRIDDPDAFEEILQTLAGYTLIRRGVTAFEIHPLIQKAIRSGMTDEPRRAWSLAALRLVLEEFPEERQYTGLIPACSRMLGHVFGAAHVCEHIGVARGDVGAVLNQAGQYLRGCHEFAAALECYSRAIALAEEKFGPESAPVAIRVNNLGVVHQDMGNLEEARACFTKAAAICERVFGPAKEASFGVDGLLLTMPIRNLCSVLEAMGDHEAALEAHARAMPIFLEVYGWNHPITAECANSTGKLWLQAGDTEKAKQCFHDAIAAEEASDNSTPGRLASYIHNLGLLLLEESDFDTAQEHFERALALDRATFGPQHISVAHGLTNLAELHRRKEKSAEALSLYRQARVIFDAIGATESNDGILLLTQMRRLYQAQDDLASARECLERVAGISAALYGENSKEYSVDLITLGRTLAELGDHEPALSCFQKALEIKEAGEDPDQEAIAVLLNRIGRELQALGRFQEALDHYERGLVIDTAVHGRDHETVGRDAYYIGTVLLDMGDSVVAHANLARALDIYENVLGINDPKTKKVRKKLETLIRKSG